MSLQLVKQQIAGHELLTYLKPMFLCVQGSHWFSSEQMKMDISFLLKQNL